MRKKSSTGAWKLCKWMNITGRRRLQMWFLSGIYLIFHWEIIVPNNQRNNQSNDKLNISCSVQLRTVRIGQGKKVHLLSSSRTPPSAGWRQPRGGTLWIRQQVPWHDQRLKGWQNESKVCTLLNDLLYWVCTFLHHQLLGQLSRVFQW